MHRGRACLQQEVEGGHSQAHRAQALCSLWSPPYSQRHLWWETGGILLQPLSLPAGQSPGVAQSLCILRTHQRSPSLGLGHGHTSMTLSYAVPGIHSHTPAPGSFRLALDGKEIGSAQQVTQLAGGQKSPKPAQPGPSPAPAQPSSQLAPANPQPRLLHTEYRGLVPGSEARLSETFKCPTRPKELGSQALTMILCRESKEHNRKPQRASLLRKVFCFVLTVPAPRPSPC